ncbi:MAG: hypothetical protein AVDCRST_MAG08-3595, partial [uncultured Acetobacteraceae bacterium]
WLDPRLKPPGSAQRFCRRTPPFATRSTHNAVRSPAARCSLSGRRPWRGDLRRRR